LVKKLSTSKGLNVGFVTKVFDSESENYATQLSKIFNEASWNVIYPINKTLLDDFNGSINIFAQHGLIANADLVCVILSEVGIRCERQPLRDGVVSGVFDQNTIYLIIGSRVIK
jgi:hypothetical protein